MSFFLDDKPMVVVIILILLALSAPFVHDKWKARGLWCVAGAAVTFSILLAMLLAKDGRLNIKGMPKGNQAFHAPFGQPPFSIENVFRRN